jgi:serine/threonine-protein kinase
MSSAICDKLVCFVAQVSLPMPEPNDRNDRLTALQDPVIIRCQQGREFKVVAVAGKGQLANVYKAIDLSTNTTVALKVPNSGFRGAPVDLLKKFEQESTGFVYNHPHVVVPRGISQTVDGLIFLSMDFIDGQTIGEILETDHTIPEEKVISLSIQICEILDHLHQAGVVHRMLCPSHILVAPGSAGEDTVNMIGLFSLYVAPSQKDRQVAFLDDCTYFSPEQCMGKRLDVRSDIYSLGCVMFECLVGVPPFRGANPIQTANQHTTHDPPWFAAISPGARIPKPLEIVLRRCLAKDMDRRPQTMTELKSNLLEIEIR